MPLQFDLIDINLYCWCLKDALDIDDNTLKEIVIYYLNKYYDDTTNDVDYSKATDEVEKRIKLLAVGNTPKMLVS